MSSMGEDKASGSDDGAEEWKPLPIDYSGVADAVDVSAMTASDLMGEMGGGGGGAAAQEEEGIDEDDDGGDIANVVSHCEEEEESCAMNSIDLGDAASATSAEIGQEEKESAAEKTGAQQAPKQDDEPTEQSEVPPPQPPRSNIASASRRMLLQIQERRHAAMLAREAEEANRSGSNNAGDGDAATPNEQGAASRASRFFARAVRKASRDRVGSSADAGGGGLVPLEEGMGPTLAAAIAADVEAEAEAEDQPNTCDTNGNNVSIDSDDKPPSTSPSTDEEEGEEDAEVVADLGTSGTSAKAARTRADSKISENHSDLEQCEWLETSSDEENSEKPEANEAEVDDGDADLPSHAPVPSESSLISSNAGSAPDVEIYRDDFSDVEAQDLEDVLSEEEKASPATKLPSVEDLPAPYHPEEAQSEATETTPEKTPEVAAGSIDENENNDSANHAEVAATAALGAVAVGVTAGAVTAAQTKSPPPVASPPSTHIEQSFTPTSSSLGLLMSSLRTAATKPPSAPNNIISREPPAAKTAPESVDETIGEEGSSEGKTQELDTAYEFYEDQATEDKDAVEESRSSPSDEVLSEDSLQDRISAIAQTVNEDDSVDDIQSAVPPPPSRRSDKSLMRTGDAGIYQGESIPHGFGSMTFANGTRFVGSWVHGEPSGEGTLYLANGEAKHGCWKDGAFEEYDRIGTSDEKDGEVMGPSVSSSDSSSDSPSSGYNQADDELSAQDINRTKISSRRSIDPSGWDETNDPSVCSTLEPNNRRNLDDESVASSPKRPKERARKSAGTAAVARATIPNGDPAAPNNDDLFHQEDRDLERGETESAMQRRRKYLREKRWYSCLPILLVFGGAACLGGGIYVWWLYLGPGKENVNSSAIASSDSGLGDSFSGPSDSFSGPTIDVAETMASPSRPIRDDDGSEDTNLGIIRI